MYWFIGQYPVTRLSTNPFNITQQFILTAVEGPNATAGGEMRRILSREPAFIVKSFLSFYRMNESVTMLLNELNDALKRDYVLANVIDGREIYRRK